MARKNIHPKLNEITVKFPNNTEVKMFSTYSKSDVFFAEVIIDKHPAWAGKLLDSSKDSLNKEIKKFESKFGSILRKKSS